MGIVNRPNSYSASTTISSSEVNDDFNTIYNEFNGSIAAANLATDSVTTAKIADANVTAAKLPSAVITKDKIDFSTGGGIWWEELGRTTLGSTGTSISVASLTARKHLLILADVRPTGGTLNVGLRFNNDSGSNYAERGSYNGAADASGGSAAQIPLKGAVDANPQLVVAEVENITAVEKIVVYHSSDTGTAGAANVPNRKEGTGKWANTAAAITRVDIIDTGGTGDIASGSTIIVLGHD